MYTYVCFVFSNIVSQPPSSMSIPFVHNCYTLGWEPMALYFNLPVVRSRCVNREVCLEMYLPIVFQLLRRCELF